MAAAAKERKNPQLEATHNTTQRRLQYFHSSSTFLIVAPEKPHGTIVQQD